MEDTTLNDAVLKTAPGQNRKSSMRANVFRFALKADIRRPGWDVRFVPIVLKKSFFGMTENSQDRWCVSLAAM
jgi:hypothetical protein